MLVNLYTITVTLGGGDASIIQEQVGLPAQGTLERVAIKCTATAQGANPYDCQIWSGSSENVTPVANGLPGATCLQMLSVTGITSLLGAGPTAIPESSTPDVLQFPQAHFSSFPQNLNTASPAAAGGAGSGVWTIRINAGGAGFGKTFEIGLLIRSPEVTFQKDSESYALFQSLP